MDPPTRGAALQHLGETFLAQEISSALAFDAGEIAADSSIDEATVQRFFDVFSINLGDVPNDYLLPSPSLLLKTHPFLRLRDKYVLPSAMLLDTAIQPVLEHLMNPNVRNAHATADKQLWERYSIHRKEYAEARSVELLQKALPGAVAYRDLKYRFNGREYELDGLILFDRYVIVEEVKAGNFSTQARSGDVDALVGDIRRLVDHPHEQGERALAYIRSAAVPTFRTAAASTSISRSMFTSSSLPLR
jgi:hypothetical protein